MQTAYRLVLREVFWLVISSGLTIALTMFLFGRNFLSATVDIHIHDTYLVLAPQYVLLPIFLLITFFVYFFKEFRASYKHKFPNWILLLSGLAVIISLTYLINTMPQYLTGGWTLYPPLSALEPYNIAEFSHNPVINILSNFFKVIQFLILAMLLYAVYCWGTQRRNS